VSAVPLGIDAVQICGVRIEKLDVPVYFNGPVIPGSPTTADATKLNPAGNERVMVDCAVVG
jgi:hypothetical protein